MASKKPTPKVSRISRDRTVAYARKQKPGAATDEPATDDTADSEAAAPAPDSGSPIDAASATSAPATPATKLHERASRTTASPTDVTASMPAVTLPVAPPTAVTAPMQAVTPPEVPAADDAPSERPRARAATVAMPIQASVGGPPAMPAEVAVAAPAVDPETAEAPTHMPGPREIPGGSPDDPSSPPGRVPSGDSRSMRRRAERYEFALIYRIQTYVICRFGMVGTRGQWRVVEYPTSASASHAYAKEVSRFVSEGFSDYRD